MVHTVQKQWGRQVWLNDSDQLLLMNFGGITSVHKHEYHKTRVMALQGYARLIIGGVEESIGDSWRYIDSGVKHQITADTDCVLYEEYAPVNDIFQCTPEQDIVRS